MFYNDIKVKINGGEEKMVRTETLFIDNGETASFLMGLDWDKYERVPVDCLVDKSLVVYATINREIQLMTIRETAKNISDNSSFSMIHKEIDDNLDEMSKMLDSLLG